MVERRIAVTAASRGKKMDKAGSITFIRPNFVIKKEKDMSVCFHRVDTTNNLLNLFKPLSSDTEIKPTKFHLK